mgnify:CR=1 FL=1
MLSRRSFLAWMASGTITFGQHRVGLSKEAERVSVRNVDSTEDIFAYVRRMSGRFDDGLFKRVLGAANEFKEGDEIVGVAAADQRSRENARTLLARTKLKDFDAWPVYRDDLFELIEAARDPAVVKKSAELTLGELQKFLLTRDEAEIKSVMAGLSSDVIAGVVKLMSNSQLIEIGQKIFNPLPGSRIGAKGYLGARIQPNSPTDNVDDIFWQVLSGWSYAVGDVVLGNNPVSSDPQSVAAIEITLRDAIETFELQDVLPHCVLSHIDVQAEVERTQPGTTALWFQSIAGSDTANATFDISVEKMTKYASERSGRFGLYFETGQGADFTNGHAHGYDMLIHESRKYGFARALTQKVAAAQRRANSNLQPWVHLNDVAGFIGPEVFRSREQLVRCCLEDIAMGKLHGLCIGLDVCSTLHMDVSLDDLDWCLDQIMPANPAYLMALPTKIDPMLGYLTTGYQDHVRLREKFGYRCDDRMEAFFQRLRILDDRKRPTSHIGDPLWVYLQYCRKKSDTRTDAEILAEGRQKMAEVRARGVFLASGHGQQTWDLEPQLARSIRQIYDDSKKCIWAELDSTFVATIPDAQPLATQSANRTDYILHPESGEKLSLNAVAQLKAIRQQHDGQYDVQIIVSDGLNALSISDRDQLAPFLKHLRVELVREGFRPAPEHLVLTSGRVRAGYRIGELMFADLPGPRAIMHVIGERPGSGHHTFSVYITAPKGEVWGRANQVDHNITKVVSGIATTALAPTAGATEAVRLLKKIV